MPVDARVSRAECDWDGGEFGAGAGELKQRCRGDFTGSITAHMDFPVKCNKVWRLRMRVLCFDPMDCTAFTDSIYLPSKFSVKIR